MTNKPSNLDSILELDLDVTYHRGDRTMWETRGELTGII